MNGVSSEPGPVPDQTVLFGEERGDFATHELVADGFVAVRVEFVRVGHFPGSAGATVVIGHGFRRGGVFLLVGVECVAVFVLGAAYFAGSCSGIYLEDCVVRTVDVGVYPKAEKMLVVVCVDPGINFCAPALGIFTGVQSVCV